MNWHYNVIIYSYTLIYDPTYLLIFIKIFFAKITIYFATPFRKFTTSKAVAATATTAATTTATKAFNQNA